MNPDWSWRPPDGVLEAIRRGNLKVARWIVRQESGYFAEQVRLQPYRRIDLPAPTQDDLDLVRAAGEGMA